MEESGHYYTVYFTSLAVGFAEDVAYQHALLAQMPDEVGWLDAANMHINECASFREYDLNGAKSTVPNNWRYLIEFVIHSLPDKRLDNASSAAQRKITGSLLLKESPVSLKFGLLLHRLGDTYAHSIMGHETRMYTTSMAGDQCTSIDSLGHARDFHSPDYPFLRKNLFYEYLSDLYRLLSEKVNSPDSKLFRRAKPVKITAGDIIAIFRYILDDPHGLVRCSMQGGLTTETTRLFFIQQIREAAKKYLGTTLKSYAPERIEKQTLPQFLSEHTELRQLGINQKKIVDAVISMYVDVKEPDDKK
jgi:hypothetical protein